MKNAKRVIIPVVIVLVVLLALNSCKDTLGAVIDQATGKADTVQEEYAEGMQTGKGHNHDAHDHDAHDHDAHDHEGAGEEHDSDEIEYDEHIWTSPVEAMKLCRAIAEALCAQDPGHAEQYRQNLEDYLARLRQLDGAFRQVVAERKRDILIFVNIFVSYVRKAVLSSVITAAAL